MSKAVTENTHWQKRAANYSTHGSRTGANLLGWDATTTETLTPEQERQAAVKAWQALYRHLQYGRTTAAERDAIRAQITEVQARISGIRPSLKSVKPKGVHMKDFFVSAAKKLLTQHQVQQIWAEASRMADAAIQKATP